MSSIGCIPIGPRYHHNGLCKVFVETRYPQEEQAAEVIPLSEAVAKKIGRSKTRYLPGERLLKKINQEDIRKRKKLNIGDMERINKSFQNLMKEF